MSSESEKTYSDAVQRVLDHTPELPTAPPVVFKLMTLLKKQNQHNEEIVEIIRYDEHLTAKLLKLCNTAFFRTSNPVSSVDQVVLRLGYSNILSIAVSLRVGDVVSKTKKTSFANPYDLWRNSVTTAIAARYLSGSCRSFEIPPDTAFTSGLLLQIGKVVLNGCLLDEVEKIRPYAESKGIALLDAEQEILGTNHVELGSILLSKWNLPDEIVDTVYHHLTPDQSPHSLPSLCNIAHVCADVSAGFHATEDVMSLIHPYALSHLSMEESQVQDTLQNIRDESSKIETFMMVA